MAKTKGAAAPAAPAPTPAAPAPAFAPVPTKAEPAVMSTGKTPAQTQADIASASAAAIAETIAESRDADGDIEPLEAKPAGDAAEAQDDDPNPAAESDDEGAEDGDESNADDPRASRRALKRREQRAVKRETELSTREQQTERDAQLLNKLFGKSLEARRAAKLGDVESTRSAISAVLEDSTGLTLDEAIVYLVDPGKAKSPESIRIERLERERADERRQWQEAQANSARAAEEAKAVEWIKGDLAGQPITKIPGYERMVLQTFVQGYNQGVTTPRKAAAKLLETLKANYEHLHAVFGAPAPAAASDGAPPRRRGSPPRGGATTGASAHARAATTGDMIADVLAEEGLAKVNDPRLAALRGKKVGSR